MQRYLWFLVGSQDDEPARLGAKLPQQRKELGGVLDKM